MKKTILSAVIIATAGLYAQVKVGNNPTNIATDAVFQIEGTNTANQFVVLKNGNVGIGTLSPASRLHVVTESSSTAGNLSAWNNTAATFGMGGASGAAVGIGFDSVNNTGWISSLTPSITWSNLKLSALSYSFTTNGSTAVMSILNNGNVGIGITNPTAQLEITGSVKFTGAGTPASEKVLTSDSAGNATWQLPPNSKRLTTDGIAINSIISLTDNGLKDLYFVDSAANILLPLQSLDGTQIRFYIYGGSADVRFPVRRLAGDSFRFNTSTLNTIGNISAGWRWTGSEIIFDGFDSRLRMITFTSDGAFWWPEMSR